MTLVKLISSTSNTQELFWCSLLNLFCTVRIVCYIIHYRTWYRLVQYQLQYQGTLNLMLGNKQVNKMMSKVVLHCQSSTAKNYQQKKSTESTITITRSVLGHVMRITVHYRAKRNQIKLLVLLPILFLPFNFVSVSNSVCVFSSLILLWLLCLQKWVIQTFMNIHLTCQNHMKQNVGMGVNYVTL